MAGPPSSAFSQLVCRYAGAALPRGAVTTHGITTPVGAFEDVITAITTFGNFIVSQCASSVTLVDILWKVGPEATGSTEIINVNQDGTQGSEPLPPQVATLVRLSPAGTSNKFAGRFFLPPMGEGATSGAGLMTTGTRDAAQDDVDSAYASLATVEATPVIFPADGGAPRDVDQVQVQQRFASQRHRNRR